MIRGGGLNTVLAWVFFGVLAVLLVWLLVRSRQDDALSPIRRPAAEPPPAVDLHRPVQAEPPGGDPPRPTGPG